MSLIRIAKVWEIKSKVATARFPTNRRLDYAKMADHGRSDFYNESLCTWIKTIVNKFAISNHTALTFIAYQIKKFVSQRIMVKTISRSDRPWFAIFCVIGYCRPAVCTFSHIISHFIR